jgi:hypothetical protein
MDYKNHRHPLNHTYHSMKRRCLSPSSIDYDRYGARGITVCDRWLGKNGFFNFRNDMGEKPNKLYTLDRVDNNKGYSPENCRWATAIEQSSNRRNSIFVKYNGRKVTLKEYCNINKLKYTTIWMRIRTYGWTIEEAIAK